MDKDELIDDVEDIICENINLSMDEFNSLHDDIDKIVTHALNVLDEDVDYDDMMAYIMSTVYALLPVKLR